MHFIVKKKKKERVEGKGVGLRKRCVCAFYKLRDLSMCKC